jgi:protein-tyrosine sulfotransferase
MVQLRSVRRTVAQVARTLLAQPEDPYRISATVGDVSEAALAAASQIRGTERPPAIMLYGVQPRSGTVFVATLLSLHPDVHAHPDKMYEVPFLAQSSPLATFQQRFLDDYPRNRTRMKENDFMPLFGSAFLTYLHSLVPPGKRLLVKEAGVEYLGRFPLVFPWEQPLLLLRDGRDVVHSSLRTWPSMDFTQACQRWAASARAMMEYARVFRNRSPGCLLIRYEEALRDPEALVRATCRKVGLDVEAYPFDSMEEVGVIGSSSVSDPGQVDWRHRDRPQDFRPTGHWQAWPARRKDRFKRYAGDALVEAGYADDLDW